MRVKCTKAHRVQRKLPGTHSEMSIMAALIIATLNKTNLYLLSENIALIKKQNQYNNTMLEEHTLFYTEDMYSKKLNNASK